MIHFWPILDPLLMCYLLTLSRNLPSCLNGPLVVDQGSQTRGPPDVFVRPAYETEFETPVVDAWSGL